jgi:hypothetical protein
LLLDLGRFFFLRARIGIPPLSAAKAAPHRIPLFNAAVDKYCASPYTINAVYAFARVTKKPKAQRRMEESA